MCVECAKTRKYPKLDPNFSGFLMSDVRNLKSPNLYHKRNCSNIRGNLQQSLNYLGVFLHRNVDIFRLAISLNVNEFRQRMVLDQLDKFRHVVQSRKIKKNSIISTK